MKAYEKTKVSLFNACEVHDSKYNTCAYYSMPGEAVGEKFSWVVHSF